MATLTTAIGPLTTSKTISAAHQTRLQAALTARLQTDQGIANPTNQQLSDEAMNIWFAELARITLRYEKEQAAVNVAPIAVT